MGDFQGHAFPGSLFVLLGLIWAVKYPLKFFSQKSKPSLKRKKCFNLLEYVEWGSMAFFPFIEIMLEQFFNNPHFQLYNEEEHKWMHLISWQHTTVYLFFMIAGIMGLLNRCTFQTPLGLDYLLFSLALFTEGMILYFHTNQHSLMNHHIHVMLLLPTFSCAFCSLLEVYLRNYLILELFRTSMILTQGTWLWQIAFVLYPRWGASKWDENDHESIVFINMAFYWHYAAVVLILSIIYGIVYCLFKKLEKSFGRTAIEIQQFSQEGIKTYTVLLNESDEE